MKTAITMEITILGFEMPSTSRAANDEPREGRWIRFKSGHVEGTARLVSLDRDPGGGGRSEIGTRLTVETGYDRVEQFRPASGQGEDKFLPVSDAGDYSIAGTIIQAWPDRVVVIRANDITFMVEVPVDCTAETVPGDKVEFYLHGLSLWDTTL